MSISIGTAIRSILLNNSTVSGLTTQIYPIFAPDVTIVPYVVFIRKSVNAEYTKDGLLYDDCNVEINIVDNNYTQCVNIAQAIRNALELKIGIFAGVQIYQCLLVSASETYDIDGYITTLEFAIKCK